MFFSWLLHPTLYHLVVFAVGGAGWCHLRRSDWRELCWTELLTPLILDSLKVGNGFGSFLSQYVNVLISTIGSNLIDIFSGLWDGLLVLPISWFQNSCYLNTWMFCNWPACLAFLQNNNSFQIPEGLGFGQSALQFTQHYNSCHKPKGFWFEQSTLQFPNIITTVTYLKDLDLACLPCHFPNITTAVTNLKDAISQTWQ